MILETWYVHCRCSSVVEQSLCKRKVAGSNPITGSIENMPGYSSGQRERSVKPLPLWLRRFEPYSRHQKTVIRWKWMSVFWLSCGGRTKRRGSGKHLVPRAGWLKSLDFSKRAEALLSADERKARRVRFHTLLPAPSYAWLRYPSLKFRISCQYNICAIRSLSCIARRATHGQNNLASPENYYAPLGGR